MKNYNNTKEELINEIEESIKNLLCSFSEKLIKINDDPSISEEVNNEIMSAASKQIISCFCHQAAATFLIAFDGVSKNNFLEVAGECFDLAKEDIKDSGIRNIIDPSKLN